MSASILEKINAEQLKKEDIPSFKVGDTVRVHVKIREGDKERIQVFSGIVIGRDGRLSSPHVGFHQAEKSSREDELKTLLTEPAPGTTG